jgi:cellobiose-specific phosphotransferase system component IIB
MALRQAWCGVVWCGVVWHGGRRGGTGRHVNVCMWACGQAELWPPIATAAVTMLVLPQSQLMLPPLKPKVKHKNKINNIKTMYQTAYCKHAWCVEAELSSENRQIY